MLIVIRSHPTHKHGANYNQYDKNYIINLCFRKIEKEIKNKNIEVIVLANGYNENELEKLKLEYKTFQFKECPVGDTASQYHAFKEIEANIDKYNSFFITEDDYYFDDGFIYECKNICESTNFAISPGAPVNPYHFSDDKKLKYIAHCFVNFAASKEMWKNKLLRPALDSTRDFNNLIQEAYFKDHVWSTNLQQINDRVNLIEISNFSNHHLIPEFNFNILK